MADKQFRSILWTVVIIFLILSAGGILFLVFYLPPGVGGSGIKIAILDSGINLDAKIIGYRVSRELEDKVILTKNFATTEYGFDENFTIVDDTEGYHGTVIALQIAGRSVGIAPESELIIGRCVDQDGVASYEALLAAFKWAVENDADIINISLGGEMIYNDTVIKEINKATKVQGVLTVIAAGNSGDETGYSFTTINGPADSLQAIAVGAIDAFGISYYSSLGPLKDHSIKPDLVDSGFSINALGTSFSAPKVAAKAAVLMSWCVEQGYKTTPGLLKAALMRSATPNVYLEHYAGAGVSNVDRAKTIIQDAQLVNGYPLVSYVSPKNLPFEITRIFRGDLWSFPLTIVSAIEQEYTISTSLELDDSILEIPDSVTINQTGLVDCKFNVSDSFTIGDHFEVITIESEYGEVLKVNVSVAIRDPILRLGFDVYHSKWNIDHLLGQFSEMRNYLASKDISVMELTHVENFSSLDYYDALILADPAAYSIRFNSTGQIESFYQDLNNDTITKIVDYVNNGSGLFVLTTDYSSSEIEDVNRLLTNFNITVTEWTVPDNVAGDGEGNFEIVEIVDFLVHPVTTGLTGIDYHGGALNITGGNAEAIATGNASLLVGSNQFIYEEKPVLAAFTSPFSNAGRVIVSGSNFMIDNWGMNDGYVANDNLDFLYNVVEWITNSTLNLNSYTKLTHTDGITINQLNNQFLRAKSILTVQEPISPLNISTNFLEIGTINKRKIITIDLH
ncbi:MAG TPA: S8 family serine peptidase [candidate division Zixibacteria bacterium]|nr:S8 family serine peptidase [candidate division Zixibacteria bacterium]